MTHLLILELDEELGEIAQESDIVLIREMIGIINVVLLQVLNAGPDVLVIKVEQLFVDCVRVDRDARVQINELLATQVVQDE